MKEAYSALASVYDRINGDGFQQSFFKRASKLLKNKPDIGWEIGCGTGTFTAIAAKDGWNMIASDVSEQMLAAAAEKVRGLEPAPLLLCQDMRESDLYGTVNAAFCCLDGINYLTTASDLRRTFKMTSLFIEPGGSFIFDLKTIKGFKQLSGTSSIWQDEDAFCAWQYGFDPSTSYGRHTVDVFIKQNGAWRRETEEHLQRAYTLELVERLLRDSGFSKVSIYDGFRSARGTEDSPRVLIWARKDK